MEIFIVGLVVVALMVYASTKIKKSAAQAFEREEIETEDFSIIKSEGFLHPLHEKSPLAFEAYSKDLGKNDASKYNQAWVALRVVPDADFKTICGDVKASAEKIISKNYVENQRICLYETERTEKDVAILGFWKIVESRQRRKIYELKISVLQAYEAEYAFRAREMIESFDVK